MATKKSTAKTEAQECTSGACPRPAVAENAPSDPFKPLGAAKTSGVVTYSFAGEIAEKVYLKTVTVSEGFQSEAITELSGVKVIPASVDGFYKVVGE